MTEIEIANYRVRKKCIIINTDIILEIKME